MAIFCLSKDLQDLKRRLGNIIVGYNEDDGPIYAKDLKAEGAMTVLLKEAINPNLVQSLEGTPAIVHGGPFANIAHGCNTIIATKLAMQLGDYVVTEAGFGADLGAEKFLDIKCRTANIKPDAIVCVATMKALKYHGGLEKEKLSEENLESLINGISNLMKHISNLKDEFGLNVIVAINKYVTDSEKEIKVLKELLEEKGVMLSLVEAWEKGGEGAKDLAEKIVNLCENKTKLNYIYNVNESIKEKIKNVATKIYGAKDVEYSKTAEEAIKQIENIGYSNLPICIAKTQYSLSDDMHNLECKEDFNIHVQDIILKAGAEFLVVLTGKIMTMPGLPRVPAAEKIDIDENNEIIGIF